MRESKQRSQPVILSGAKDLTQRCLVTRTIQCDENLVSQVSYFVRDDAHETQHRAPLANCV
jgi:hypothetical protein